jgi:hypothetical protein
MGPPPLAHVEDADAWSDDETNATNDRLDGRFFVPPILLRE